MTRPTCHQDPALLDVVAEAKHTEVGVVDKQQQVGLPVPVGFRDMGTEERERESKRAREKKSESERAREGVTGDSERERGCDGR